MRNIVGVSGKVKTKKKRVGLKMLVEVDRAIKKVADLEKLYAKMVQKK